MIINRQKQLLTEMDKKKVEMAFVISPIHIAYLTGFYSDPHERFFVLLFDAKLAKTYLFLPELDYDKSKEVAQVDEIIPIKDTDDGFAIVKKTIKSDVSTIAIEKNIVTLLEYEKLSHIFPNSSFVQFEDVLMEMRLYKSEAEIEHVKEAIRLTEKGLEHITKFVKIGMSEVEVKMELEFYLQSIGAEKMAFETTVLTGENSALPHGVSGVQKISVSDFLLFDFGVTVNGYHSDITRTFLVREGTEEQEKIYQIVKEANKRAIEAVKVGQPLKRIDKAAREVIEKNGYGNYFTHRTGHGLGIEIHEPPSIHEENEMPMKEGMLFTIEPGIYVPNIGGVRIEDDIYVNELGETKVLTSYPKELIYLEG